MLGAPGEGEKQFLDGRPINSFGRFRMYQRAIQILHQTANGPVTKWIKSPGSYEHGVSVLSKCLQTMEAMSEKGEMDKLRWYANLLGVSIAELKSDIEKLEEKKKISETHFREKAHRTKSIVFTEPSKPLCKKDADKERLFTSRELVQVSCRLANSAVPHGATNAAAYIDKHIRILDACVQTIEDRIQTKDPAKLERYLAFMELTEQDVRDALEKFEQKRTTSFAPRPGKTLEAAHSQPG